MCGLTSRKCMPGARTPNCAPAKTLTSATMPPDSIVCPTTDFTEEIANGKPVSSDLPVKPRWPRMSELASTTSPNMEPKACASTTSTSNEEMPAFRTVSAMSCCSAWPFGAESRAPAPLLLTQQPAMRPKCWVSPTTGSPSTTGLCNFKPAPTQASARMYPSAAASKAKHRPLVPIHPMALCWCHQSGVNIVAQPKLTPKSQTFPLPLCCRDSVVK
mmetsp:Transcript_122160/g.353227  ORF Transcript_122160/g.353227 Transcript_122160/m.353227 type:complete len:216 (-) Transcript_122160:1458-2105(-)